MQYAGDWSIRGGSVLTNSFQVQEIILHPDEGMENVKTDNNILFIGLGLTAIGLVTLFTGLGDKGFMTLGLQLVGPCPVLAGALLVVFRVLLCCGLTDHHKNTTQNNPRE